MSTDEYVPSEAEMMIAWHRHATAEDAKHGRLRDDGESATKEFVRYMARVRRDAAREALDGLAKHFDRMGDGADQADQWAWEWHAEDETRDYRDTHYPEPFTWTEEEDARRLQSIADGAADHYPEETP